MITSILGGIQTLVNLLFLVVVLGTAALSWWLSTKYRQRYANANNPMVESIHNLGY